MESHDTMAKELIELIYAYCLNRIMGKMRTVNI